MIMVFNQQTRKPLYHYIRSEKKAPSVSTDGMVEFHWWTRRSRDTNKSLEQEKQQLVSNTKRGKSKGDGRWWKSGQEGFSVCWCTGKADEGRRDYFLHCFPPSALSTVPAYISLTLKRAWIYLQLMTGDTYPWKPPGCSICHRTHPKLSKVYLFILAFILHLPYFCTAQAAQCKSGSSFL